MERSTLCLPAGTVDGWMVFIIASETNRQTDWWQAADTTISSSNRSASLAFLSPLLGLLQCSQDESLCLFLTFSGDYIFRSDAVSLALTG